MAGLAETWEWRNPLPQGSGIKAMTEADGKLIAVGRAGTVLTTTDGMNWTPRVSGSRNHLRAVAASGATVVAVGREGDIVTSTDGGLTWSLRSSGAVEWNTVIHGGGVWVAGGIWPWGPPPTITGAVMTSPDGLTWTTRTVSDAGFTEFTCSVWTGTRFVLGGTHIQRGTVLVTSEDGITWTKRTADLLAVNALAWTGSHVVAAGLSSRIATGDIFVSLDGTTWTDALTPNPPGNFLNGVLWTGTQLFAWPQYGTTPAYTSPTAETWTSHVLSTNPQFYPGAAASAGNTLVVGGDSGLMVHSPDGGATWNAVTSGVAGNLNALTRFAGRFVAAGGEGSLTSSADGVTWTPASSGTISRLRALTWHDGLWVAGGREEVTPPGLSAPRRYSVSTSTDGVTWTDRSFGDGAFERQQLYSVIRAGPQWVATALYAVLTSPDGVTWQERAVGEENRAVAWNGSRLIVAGGVEDEGGDANGWVHLSDDGGVTWSTQSLDHYFLRGVTWTGSQFVAVGDAGAIYTSPTGAANTWTYRNIGTFMDLRCVTADSGGLVVVGGNFSTGPVIWTSPDGVIWTMRTAPTTKLLYSVIKAGALYVATGYDGVVLTSPDAITWTLRDTGTTHELYAAAWDGAQLLVSGEGGAILASTAGSTPVTWKSIVKQPGPGQTFRLTWPALSGRVYDIESTTTLTPPWLPVPGSPRTATGAEEFIDFTEPGPSAALRRFFRVSQRP